MRRPISLSLSPNVQLDDVLLALRCMFSPWEFFKENYIKMLEQWFCQFFSVSYAVAFNSGRTALITTLRALHIGVGDEVILQACTCVAVPNAILALGAKPVYCDVTSSLTLDPLDVEEKVTKKTKAIILQHTFGIPSDMDSLLKIARKHKIVVIEDCAHAIGGVYKKKKLGTFGDCAIFSFGRDKAFSCVFGGMAITNKKNIGSSLREQQENMRLPSFLWVYQQLLHPVAFSVILPLYNMLLGKVLLVALQRMHLLSFPVFPKEKQGKMDRGFIKRMPNGLACLALAQVRKHAQYNNRRTDIARGYMTLLSSLKSDIPYTGEIAFLRFPLFVDNKSLVSAFFRKHNIYLGTWYSNVIDPKGVDFKAVHYTLGACPNAEKYASLIINLPTYPTMTDEQVGKCQEVLRRYVEDKRNRQ